MTHQQKPSMADTTRRAIRKSKISRRELCHQADLDPGNFSRFMNYPSHSLTVKSLEKLAPVLGLRLVQDGPEG